MTAQELKGIQMQSAARPAPRLCWELSLSHACLCQHSNPSMSHRLCAPGRALNSMGNPSIPLALEPAEPRGDHGKEWSLLAPPRRCPSIPGEVLWLQPFPSQLGPHCWFLMPGSAAGLGAPVCRSSQEPAGLQEMQASRRSRHPGNSGGGWDPAGSPVLSECMTN